MAVADNIIFEVIQPKNYTDTLNNYVGQDTSAGLIPANSSGDTCYIASSGSNSNAGNYSAPVQTVSHANDVCQSSGLTKLCLIDNSYYTEGYIKLSTGITDVFAYQDALPSFYLASSTLPSTHIETLSSINRRLYNEYNDELYAACSSGSAQLIYHTSDGEIWSSIHDNGGDNYISKTSTITTTLAGAYFGNDNGQIIKFTASTSSGVSYNQAGESINGICEFNSYLWAVSSGTSQKLLRSADGATFSDMSASFPSDVSGQDIKDCIEYDDELIIAFENSILSTTNGTSFTVEKNFDIGSFEIEKLFVFDNTLYFTANNAGVYKTVDLTTYSKIFAGNVKQIESNNNLYIITESGICYRSTDGTAFNTYATLTTSEIYLGVYKGLIYAGDKRFNSYFLKARSDVTFTGLKFETSILDYAIYTDGKNLTTRYSTIDGFSNYGIYKTANYTSSGVICQDSYGGVRSSGTALYRDCVFHTITEKAVHDTSTNLTVNHCTFFDCKYGLYLDEPTTNSIKNSIFYYCHENAIESNLTLTMDYCVYSRAGLGTTVTATNSIKANPIFESTAENNVDLNIKTIETGYEVLNSPCKEAGDDGKNIGAYDVSYTEADRTAIQIELTSIPTTFQFDDIRTDYNGEFSISGNPLIKFDNVRRSFIFTWDSNTYIKETDIYKYWRLFNMHSTFWYKPANATGYADNTGTGIFSSGIISNYPEAQLALDIKNNNYDVIVMQDNTQSWEIAKWRGWYVTSSGIDMKVLYNTSNTLILDHSSVLSSGSYTIEKIKGRFDGNSQKQIQQLYDGFKESQIINNVQLSFVEASE